MGDKYSEEVHSGLEELGFLNADFALMHVDSAHDPFQYFEVLIQAIRVCSCQFCSNYEIIINSLDFQDRGVC